MRAPLEMAGMWGMQAMEAADPGATWLMQAWLFYDDQDFWQPPQIQVRTSSPLHVARPLCTPHSLQCAASCTATNRSTRTTATHGNFCSRSYGC